MTFAGFDPRLSGTAIALHPRMQVARLLLVLAACLAFPAAAFPQSPPAGAQDPPASGNLDIRIDPLQPDFTLAALPTTLRMPAGRWAFRVTHRFTRDLGAGDFGDLVADLFGLDSGSQIGLEVRIGVRDGLQAAIHRTNDRTIQLLLQQNLQSERDGDRFGFDALATLEGADNLSEHHQSALGVILSKAAAGLATVYVAPLVVLNANPGPGGDDHSLLVGLGGRLRLGSTTYLTGEFTPRVAGFDPAAHQMTFALEKRTGGHLFQLNVGNGFGTTFGQLARGGLAYDQWFLGFNISRKFFR